MLGIEVFFSTAKQHLELDQSRDFDALIAHTAIFMARYILLGIEKSRADDPRTLGLLVHSFCQESKDCTLVKALCQILSITLENLKNLGLDQSRVQQLLL